MATRGSALRTLTITALACVALPAWADGVQDIDDDARNAVVATVESAVAVAASDRVAAAARIDAALVAAQSARTAADDPANKAELGRKRGGLRARLARLVTKLGKARDAVTGGEPDDERAVKVLRKASRTGHSVLRLLRKFPARGFAFEGKSKKKAGFHAAGSAVVLRFAPGTLADGSTCSEEPVFTVAAADDPGTGLETVIPDVESLGDGRYAVTLGPDLGGARIEATACGITRTWTLFNWGAAGALGQTPPANLVFVRDVVEGRAGTAIAPNPATVEGSRVSFSIAPDLPGGMLLDPALGTIRGTPTVEVLLSEYTVTARNGRGLVTTDVSVAIEPPLHEAVAALEFGFVAEPILTGLAVPVKMARAADGRLFFNELATGKVRVVDAQGQLLQEPFATVNVLSGFERGLLGIALAPDFAQSGHLYVYASVPAGGGHQERNQVLRFTAQGNVGTDATPIVDDLPIGLTQNAGDIQFGPDGNLYVSIGDTGDFDQSQRDGSLAGRILRYAPDGSIPPGNPDPASPEWCRGLRNSFDMTFHPVTGGLFATENGPTVQDELNFVQPGKNFLWGGDAGEISGAITGIRIVQWTPVIVPTGIAFHDGTGFGPEYSDDLFLCTYDAGDVSRVVLSGGAFTDLDEVIPFAQFHAEDGVDNKPLDILVEPDGSLLISTFSAIWRIRRYQP